MLLDSSNGDRDCEPLDPPGHVNNPHYSSTDTEVEPALVPQTATGLRYDQAAAELPHKPGWRIPRRRGRQRSVQLRSLSVPSDHSSDSDQHRRRKRLRSFTSEDQPYRDRDLRRIAERRHETALWNRCEGCQDLGHTIDFCPRKWCGYCRDYGDHELVDRDGRYLCPFYWKKRVNRIHEAEQRKLRPVYGRSQEMGKGKQYHEGKGAKGKQAGKGKDSWKGAYAAGRQWLWDNHRRERSPSRDHRDRDRDRDRDNRRRDGNVDQDRSRDRRRRSPSAEPRGRSRRKQRTASDDEEAEVPERSESKKRKKKKKSKIRSDEEEANDDEPPSVSLPHRTTEPEASDDGEDNLEETVSIFNDNDELELDPAKGKVDSTSTDRDSTPPPPDPKKVLSKDYDLGLSGKFKGTKTNLDADGDEADKEAKAIDVKAAKATPDKSAKTALEEKQANLEKMLEETKKQLQNEDLKVVLKSKDSEKDKLDQAYLLGRQAADADKRSRTPPQSRESRDLTQIPRSDDVPLGIPPEEWQSLELQRKISIRKIAQDPERSLYFDWGNALFSGKKAEVQKTLDCLATKPAHKLSGLFNKPEKAGLKLSAKEADKALASSIVKQAQQAFSDSRPQAQPFSE